MNRSLLAAVSALLLSGAAPAGAAVQLDFSSAFNADVILNTDAAGPDGLDATQSDVDDFDYALLTQAAAVKIGCGSPAGLPDSGLFPATPTRPEVQLGYSDSNSGFNARRSTIDGDAYTVSVPAGRYVRLHVFATGGGAPAMDVTLNYADGTSTTKTFRVGNWYFASAAASYELISGMDRVWLSGPSCEDANTVRVFGYAVFADPSRDLTGLTIVRPAEEWWWGVLAVFGAVAEDNGVLVTHGGSAGGTITSNPPGISCGSDCFEVFAPGTQVELSASPFSGARFRGWSGACTGTGTCTLTAGGPQHVTAAFDVADESSSGGGGGGSATTATDGTGGPSAGTQTAEAASDQGAPSGILKARSQFFRDVVRRGLAATIGCDERCNANVEVLVGRRSARRARLSQTRRYVRIGSARMDVSGSGRQTIAVPLSRTARARLGGVRRLVVEVRATVTDAAGNATVVSRDVTLRR